MADKKMGYRLNPRHWRLDRYKVNDLELTHEPQELTAAQAKTVLGSTYRGLPLAVEVDMDAKDPEAAAEEAAAKGDEAAETETEADNA